MLLPVLLIIYILMAVYTVRWLIRKAMKYRVRYCTLSLLYVFVLAAVWPATYFMAFFINLFVIHYNEPLD